MAKYVTKDVSASNLNDGSDATTNAWETALYGFTNVGASNTLIFGTGTYDIDRNTLITPIPNGTSGNPTIITDNADGTVTFQHPGSGWLGLINFSTGSGKSYISFIGTSANQLIFDGENQSACATLFYLSNGVPSLNSNITLQNCELKRSTTSCILGGWTSDITVDGCTIHDSGTHSVGTPPIPQDHGVYASGTNLIVKNCTIYNIWGWGITIYSSSGSNRPGRELYNNHIYNCGHGGGGEGGDGIQMTEGSGTIYNNVVHDCGGQGITLWRNTKTYIYHNSCYNNGFWGIQVGDGGGTPCTDTVVKNNISIGNGSGDLRIRSNSSNAIVQWNLISDATITNQSGSTTAANNTGNAVDTNVWVDPANVTPASRDFNLKAGSAAIAPTGIEAVGIATDIAGDTRVFVDQGAYAYGSPGSPTPPIISHDASYVVTTEYGAITITLTKGTNNIVECTISGTGASALCIDPTNVTVALA